MARFRRSGTNWEGRRWYTSTGLNALMDEIEAAFPLPGPADGTVASKTHDQTNPRSDHRPTPYTGTGVVRAVDAGEYVEDQGIQLAEAIRASKDPRVKYVIHERRIFASYARSYRPAWTWGDYGGNAHLNHVHVSVNTRADSDGSAWGLDLGENVKEVYARLQASLIRVGYDLGNWTPYLPATDPDSLPGADGVWGDSTRAAQDAANKSGSGTVGPPGPQGPKGDKGAKGDPGKDGADGTLIIKGEVELP